MIDADRFVELYGGFIDIDDLARVLDASRREAQALMRRKGVTITTVGNRQVVSTRAATVALGITETEALLLDMARIRRESSHHPDGRPKTVHEYFEDLRKTAARSP